MCIDHFSHPSSFFSAIPRRASLRFSFFLSRIPYCFRHHFSCLPCFISFVFLPSLCSHHNSDRRCGCYQCFPGGCQCFPSSNSWFVKFSSMHSRSHLINDILYLAISSLLFRTPNVFEWFGPQSFSLEPTMASLV